MLSQNPLALKVFNVLDAKVGGGKKRGGPILSVKQDIEREYSHFMACN